MQIKPLNSHAAGGWRSAPFFSGIAGWFRSALDRGPTLEEAPLILRADLGGHENSTKQMLTARPTRNESGPAYEAHWSEWSGAHPNQRFKFHVSGLTETGTRALLVLLLTALRIYGQSNLNFQIILTGPFYTPLVTNVPYVGSGWGLASYGDSGFGFAVGAGPYLAVGGGIYGPAEPGKEGQLIFGFNAFQVIGVAPDPPYNVGGDVVYAGYALALSSPQLHQLQAGLWYVRIELAEFFDEPATLEARGQILLVPKDDSDADGVPDCLDPCAYTPPFTIVGAHGCSIEQLCPCEGPWKSHGDYVAKLAELSASFVHDGVITSADRRRFLQEAAMSECGKRLPHADVRRNN